MMKLNKYKQTEFGLIPEDWNLKCLFKVGEVDSESLNSNTPKDYDFKYISLEDVNKGVLKGYSEVSFGNAPSRARRIIRKGDILFGTVRPNLKSHCEINIEVKDFICSTGFAVLRVDESNYSNKLVYQHLYGTVVDRQINTLLVGSNYPAINSKEFKNLVIPLPPTLAEQKAIATALSDADELINKLDKLIAKKKAIKQGAMQQLLTPPHLGGKRLPGFIGDWEEISLGDRADISKLAGFEYSKYFNSYLDGGEIIVVRGTNITKNRFDFSDVKTIPLKTSQFLKRSQLNKGDLVFAYVGTIGPVCLIEENDKFHLGPNTARITVDSHLNVDFILSLFKSWLIEKEIEFHTSTGAQPSLSMTKIRSFKLSVPKDFEEQKAIAQILSDMDEELDLLEAKKSKYQDIKQGMMQELLTGKTRLV